MCVGQFGAEDTIYPSKITKLSTRNCGRQFGQLEVRFKYRIKLTVDLSVILANCNLRSVLYDIYIYILKIKILFKKKSV